MGSSSIASWNSNIANATFGWGMYDSSADGSFQIWNKNNSTTGYNALTIKRGGNVGIGTNSPGTTLEVHSGGATSFIRARYKNILPKIFFKVFYLS